MNRKKCASIAAVLACAVAVTSLPSCTTDYVTGKKTFSLVSESQEVAMGKEADPQIVAEYGAYDAPELTAYINEMGQGLAACWPGVLGGVAVFAGSLSSR